MMNIRFISLSLLLCGMPLLHAQQKATLCLVPQPAQVEQSNGQFVFGKKISACADAYAGDSIQWVLRHFENKFTRATNIAFKRVKKGGQLQLKLNNTLEPEAYKLNITQRNIVIEASRPVGFFYALQTLQQLLPNRSVLAGVKSDTLAKGWSVPVVSICDKPRFAWRGFMLDEGRHFYGKDAVKKILDLMSAYKMNRFHWHLTEDQGWRIEIKKYPKLTDVGAWRNSKVLAAGDVKNDTLHYGGFYTQQDAREIVNYAHERFIEIVPEIDIPGHSQAAVASYPEFLACDPQNAHEVWLHQGVSADVINVADSKAVTFANDVIDELSTIFPYEYIHLGGDECPTYKWERNTECQNQLKALGSHNYRDLQINFYKQIKEHMAQKPAKEQRKLIFWNEVLHGNTQPLGNDITIMAWIGADKAAKDAAQRGFNTILSPQIPYYINRKQSQDASEPHSQGWGTETVQAVYNYVPMKDVEERLHPKYLGVQANFWTEWVEDASTVEYLMFPRLAAVAEAGWTPQSLRNYNDFVQRMQQEPAFYKAAGVNYGKHIWKNK